MKVVKIKDKKEDNFEGVDKNFNQKSFSMFIVGSVGSGKTQFLYNLLNNKDLYYKKFDYIFIMSKSPQEISDIKVPEDQIISEFNIDWIYEKIKILRDRQIEAVNSNKKKDIEELQI